VEQGARKAVPHPFRCDIKVAGADQERPSAPKAIATPNSPIREGSPRASSTLWRSSGRLDIWIAEAARPIPKTGRAGELDNSTTRVTDATATMTTPRTGRSGSIRSRWDPTNVRRSATPTPSAVTKTAAAQAGAIRARKCPPEMWRWPRTMRFVRFEPGSSTDDAFESRRHP